MKATPNAIWMSIEDDNRISDWIAQGQSRLRNFIRKRVPNAADVEDILQDSFYELVEAFRLMRPVEHIGPWLFRVAQNRITGLYRKTKPEASTDDVVTAGEDGGLVEFSDLLPSADSGPEAAYARSVLLDELAEALDELPDEHRAVFIAHEIEGRSFKELSVGNWCKREYVAFAQALRRPLAASTASNHLRRIRERMRQMKTKWIERVVKLATFAIVSSIVMAAIIGGMSEGVHELWNWLMPGIFRLPPIQLLASGRPAGP
jgi:RNA polymerase sigma factor (sigma-70 family)